MVDLRYADFTSPDVDIHAYSIMGGQTILVPPEVNVTITGVGVMGAFDHDVDERWRTRRTERHASAASRCGAASGSSARIDGRSSAEESS